MNKKLQKLLDSYKDAQKKLCAAINKEYPVGAVVTFNSMDGKERLTGTISKAAKNGKPTWLSVLVERDRLPSCVCASFRDMKRA